MAPPQGTQQLYAKDEKVLCFHGELLYEAKILDSKLSEPTDRKSPILYYVHYKGWKNTWDDWVSGERVRKLTEENKELAKTLKRDLDAARKPQPSKSASGKKRGGASDQSSNRGSEERQTSLPATGRGKRGREDLDKDAQPHCEGFQSPVKGRDARSQSTAQIEQMEPPKKKARIEGEPTPSVEVPEAPKAPVVSTTTTRPRKRTRQDDDDNGQPVSKTRAAPSGGKALPRIDTKTTDKPHGPSIAPSDRQLRSSRPQGGSRKRKRAGQDIIDACLRGEMTVLEVLEHPVPDDRLKPAREQGMIRSASEERWGHRVPRPSNPVLRRVRRNDPTNAAKAIYYEVTDASKVLPLAGVPKEPENLRCPPEPQGQSSARPRSEVDQTRPLPLSAASPPPAEYSEIRVSPPAAPEMAGSKPRKKPAKSQPRYAPPGTFKYGTRSQGLGQEEKSVKTDEGARGVRPPPKADQIAKDVGRTSKDARIREDCPASAPAENARFCFPNPKRGAMAKTAKKVFDAVLTIIVEQEENFLNRSEIRIPTPDHLKALLVDDWEHVTKNLQLVSLPKKVPTNQILDKYFDEEKQKRGEGSASADILQEVVAGVKEYFNKCLGRILLYRIEREQYYDFSKLWEGAGGTEWEGKGPGDVYGAEHLARLIVKMPELIAQTNMDSQSVHRLREEISKLCLWLAKHSSDYFTGQYETPPADYVAKTRV